MSREQAITRPDRFWIGEERWTLPFAVIDLEAGDAWPDEIALPPCPVIGIGSLEAPDADKVDTVIEAPATLDGVIAHIERNPRAAGVIVQLLRILPGLDVHEGLVAESLAYATLQGSEEHRNWKCQYSAGFRSQSGRVRLTRTGEVLEVVLDRPEADNAIDRPMRDALHEALLMAAIDPAIEQVVLRGEGKAFSLGADLSEFGTTLDPATAHAIRSVTLPAQMAARIGDRLEARIQGACVGSALELAGFASRVVAGPRAWFQLLELTMGILPGAGGCVSLTRRIGRQRAALLILSGKRLSAGRALDWGLVDTIVDDLA
ncbi:MAG: enoyl-CoA hydratase/isomerase family protein [Alphaproteobacteria bacterium]|nr:enoyl-CoA hydratase/isomerase family protein [Alphaproteobacteria bacterium]